MNTDRFVEILFSSFAEWFPQVNSDTLAHMDASAAADPHALALAFDHE